MNKAPPHRRSLLFCLFESNLNGRPSGWKVSRWSFAVYQKLPPEPPCEEPEEEECEPPSEEEERSIFVRVV